MKGLSVRQPWASLEVANIKPVENRTRPTNYRGPLLIHAAKRPDWVQFFAVTGGKNINASLAKYKLKKGRYLRRDDDFPLGAIIGQVNLIDCVQNHPSEWAESGAWHWVFADAKAFDTPVPYPGRLGLFDAPDPDDQHLFKPHDGKTRRVCITEEPPDIMITRPGKWGNKWKVKPAGKGDPVSSLRDGKKWIVWDGADTYLGVFDEKASAIYYAVRGYGLHLAEHPELIDAAKRELKGKRLGCFCKPDQPCHGDILVRLVEGMK